MSVVCLLRVCCVSDVCLSSRAFRGAMGAAAGLSGPGWMLNEVGGATAPQKEITNLSVASCMCVSC